MKIMILRLNFVIYKSQGDVKNALKYLQEALNTLDAYGLVIPGQEIFVRTLKEISENDIM
jgi:hypothetical protein